ELVGLAEPGELVSAVALGASRSAHLPLEVQGIDPGETSTISAAPKPCSSDSAEVTSRLTASNASSGEGSGTSNSMMATSFSARWSCTDIAATRPPVYL